MTDHEKRIREALEAGPVQYACHVDGPDGIDATCVLDSNRPQDCFYARRLHEKGLCKTDCAEWQPINAPKSTVEVSAANLRALLADLDAVRADAQRYRLLRRGQHWSVVDGVGDILRAEELDAKIDTALKGASHD